MPPTDDDVRGFGSFDLVTATNVFWKSIPVLLRQSDREDVVESLTFRILSGSTKHNHNLRVLRIHISSEEDYFFLHTLEVSEEDFQSLKAEQGILVDFSNFPSKVISLLERCTAPHESDTPRFQAVLVSKPTESIFKIVETNDFKQLPHITLSFRPGNDFAVKQFLAFRLSETRAELKETALTLGDTQAERDSARQGLSSTQGQLSALREKYERMMLELQADTKSLQATAHEEKLREKSQLKDQLDRERQEAERKYNEQLSALQARISELDIDNRKLREQKYELDTKVSELSHRLGSAEGSNRVLEEEAGKLRDAQRQLSAQKHEADIALNEARARAAALEDKVAAAGDLSGEQALRVRDLEGAVRQWEATVAEQRSALAAAGQRAAELSAEVLRGNQIIEKLTADLRLTREKVKRKQAILVRQEEELAARDARVAALTRELSDTRQAGDTLGTDLAAAQADAADLRARLDDSRAQLQSNEQMIRWLNQQVTEAQLQAGTGAASSRYTFRPSGVPHLSTPAGALSTGSAPYSSYQAGAVPGVPSTSRALGMRLYSPNNTPGLAKLQLDARPLGAGDAALRARRPATAVSAQMVPQTTTS